VPNIPNDIALNLQILRLRFEGKMACEGCGCELMEADVVEGEDGELLCEECADEMYESIEEAAGGDVFHFLLDGDEKFSFHAKDAKDAKSKALGWLHRHGMMGAKKGLEVLPGPGSYKNNMHDEWMESIEEGEDSSLEECACQDEVTEADLTEKAQSKFKKLVGQLKKKGATSPEGLAAWIGAKKAGKGDVAKGRKILRKMAAKARKAG